MFGLFSGKKAFQAQINTEGTIVEIAAGDNLLNAALISGIAWPHNCRVGSCGTCRCRLVSGKIKELNDFSYVLDGDELDAGMILACQTRAKSDLEVAVELDPNAIPLAIAQATKGTVISSKNLTHDILELRISLDSPLPDYLAGQYAELAAGGIDLPRSYSFAACPSLEAPGICSFYIRKVPNGELTTWLHAENREGQPITIEGPLGTFYLREGQSPVICIAGGSGLAPIKALLEQMAHDKVQRKTVFLFGARTRADLYCLDEMDALKVRCGESFDFVPVLSEEPADSDWQGLRGMVTEHIGSQGFDLTASEAYLCGPPPMIDSAIDVLTGQGMADDRIFFDKFLDASHLPGGKRQ